MAFVLDASVVLAWLLPDERSEAAERLIERVISQRPHAPSLLLLEVGNALLQAERRGRLSAATRLELLDAFTSMPIALEPLGAKSMLDASAMAASHSLTVYDACYLQLALVRNCALATFDDSLSRAAGSFGVAILS